MAELKRYIDNTPLLITTMLVIDSLHFVFARLLLPHLAPACSALYVLAVATIEVGLIGLFSRRLRFEVLRKNIWFFLSVGFLVAVSTNLNYEAVAYIDPGTAAMLAKTSILFGIGFGLVWLKDRLGRMQILGACVAVIGAFIITFQPGNFLRLGSIMVLCSTFMYASHAALTKRYGQDMEFMNFFFFRLLCTGSLLFIIAMSRGLLAIPDRKTVLLLVMVGTADITISRSLYYLALRRLTVSIHAIVLALSPVAAILWSLLLFDTFPNHQQLIGGIAVITGVLMVLLRRGT